MTSQNAAPPGGWTEADKVPPTAKPVRTLPREIDGVLTWGRTSWKVEKLEEDPDRKVQYGYKLTGVRGAEYMLMRNVHRPHDLFPINATRLSGSTPFRHLWFTDRNGYLELIT